MAVSPKMRPDCRLSNYFKMSNLNAYCWMHEPACPYGRPVLTGFRRWWVHTDGAGLAIILALVVLIALCIFAVAVLVEVG